MGSIALRVLGAALLAAFLLAYFYPADGQFNIGLVIIVVFAALAVIALIHRWWSNS